jgi:hypothetical protein
MVPASLLPYSPSPLAVEARALVDAGKAVEAQHKLEAALGAAGGDGRDASAHLALGDARLAQDEPLDALSAYELGIALDPAAARDERARRNVLDLAAHGKTWKVRQRAAAVAAKLGVGDKVDRAEAALLDLQQAPGCPERRDALLVLWKLKDARAAAAIKRARARRSGFFGTGRPNSCLEKEATEALAELEPAPPEK